MMIEQQLHNMTYEQLLQQFGDGTENYRYKHASHSTISSLPIHQQQQQQHQQQHQQQQQQLVVVSSKEEEEKNTTTSSSCCCCCSICLEEYQIGDWKKSLPCFHSFHVNCIDVWLGLNGICPICKTPVVVS